MNKKNKEQQRKFGKMTQSLNYDITFDFLISCFEWIKRFGHRLYQRLQNDFGESDPDVWLRFDIT